MTDYTTDDLSAALENNGELLLTLGSDAYAEPVELHGHDTTFDHDRGEVVLDLTDGQLQFHASDVESVARHKQSLADLGL